MLAVQLRWQATKRLCSVLTADDDGPMSNYHVSQCTALINNPQASADVRTIAEGLVAMANGIDDADSMVQQALERIDIVLERIQHIEKRLELLEAGL
jgi:DNA repair ATPase RecN